MHTDDKENPGTIEGQFRPGEGSSGPGGKYRNSYERYGNYGMVNTDPKSEENERPLPQDPASEVEQLNESTKPSDLTQEGPAATGNSDSKES